MNQEKLQRHACRAFPDAEPLVALDKLLARRLASTKNTIECLEAVQDRDEIENEITISLQMQFEHASDQERCCGVRSMLVRSPI